MEPCLHLSYLPHSGAVFPQLTDELKGYSTSSGALRFGIDEPLPVALVEKLIAVRLQQAFPLEGSHPTRLPVPPGPGAGRERRTLRIVMRTRLTPVSLFRQCALGAGPRLEAGAVNLAEVDAHADDRDRPAHVQEQARAQIRVPEAGGGVPAGVPAARAMTADHRIGGLGIAAACPGQPVRRGLGPAPALARPVLWTVPRLHGWSSAC